MRTRRMEERMRLGTRILALALCVILLLGLCGCLPVPVAQDALDS